MEKHAEVDPQDYNRKTPLHWAVEKKYLDVVEVLLGQGAESNILDSLGETPLHKAAANGCVEIVKMLLDNGVNINAQDDSSKTPLHKAAANGYVDIVKMLLDNGVNINAQDDSGKTPLHWAAENNHLTVIEKLLNHHARTDVQDINNRIPLHLASENGYVSVAKKLFDTQPRDAHVKDKLNETPKQKAEKNNHANVVAIFKHGHPARLRRSIPSDVSFSGSNSPYSTAVFFPKSLIAEHSASMINSQAESQKGETDQTVNHNLEDNTLILTDLIVRRWTKEKHPFFIGSFSKERVLEERLRPVEKMLEDSLNKFNTNNKP